MKKLFSVMVLTLALAGSVYAHCGKCGMDGAKTDAAHSGAQCPMHGEKNAVLTEASEALKATNPDLSAKLSDLSAKCCNAH